MDDRIPSDRRVGVWLLGSRGSVATTTVAAPPPSRRASRRRPGSSRSTRRSRTPACPGSTSSSSAGTTSWRPRSRLRAARLVDDGVIPHGLLPALEDKLGAAEAEQRPGIGARGALGAARSRRPGGRRPARVPRSQRARARRRPQPLLDRAPDEPDRAHGDPDELLDALDRGQPILPPSSLYALAAIETGCAFVDFTPSTGARLPALEALAETHEVPLAGRDGKTGETLMKTALAPAFAARNLRVRSWAGMNLLGGGDGATLAEPERARSKLASKARSLEEILGYPVEAPVRIDQVKDLGEWKTAWDHVTFEGFLGVRMRMQFIWEGCDSALAAPLLLDLARFGALALERGEAGVVPELAFFFKDPAGTREHALDRQYETLRAGCSRRSRLEAPEPRAVAELVRLPAVLSVPGDVLLGAAAAGRAHEVRRAAGLAGASSCLYLAGMALNDYADRAVDARERPSRPIPSGRVTPRFALGLAAGLTAAGAALAVAAEGRRALVLLGPLAAAVWAYDLVLKQTDAGPAGMSACRALDVLLGAGLRGIPSALPAAAVVGAHTAVVTTVSRREVGGATRDLALGAPGGDSAGWQRRRPRSRVTADSPASACSRRTRASSAAHTRRPRATPRRSGCSAQWAQASWA